MALGAGHFDAAWHNIAGAGGWPSLFAACSQRWHSDYCDIDCDANPYAYAAERNTYINIDARSSQHAIATTDTYTHTDANSLIDKHGNADIDFNANPDANLDANPNKDTHSDADPHLYPHAVSDPNTNAHTVANIDIYINTNAHTVANTDIYINANAHTVANTDIYINTNSHTVANIDIYINANAHANEHRIADIDPDADPNSYADYHAIANTHVHLHSSSDPHAHLNTHFNTHLNTDPHANLHPRIHFQNAHCWRPSRSTLRFGNRRANVAGLWPIQRHWHEQPYDQPSRHQRLHKPAECERAEPCAKPRGGRNSGDLDELLVRGLQLG